MKLPENFLLGVATAATQIEGGDTNNSWYDWAKKGGTVDGSSPVRANDHVNRYKDDIALMAKMNMQIYRLGIEWGRIEPEQGVFSTEGIEFYRSILLELKKYDIKPLVTLYHFTVPLWFQDLGAFEKAENNQLFLQYVEYVVENLGDLVAEWITINEPNVYTVNGYFFGIWPPGKKSIQLVRQNYGNLTYCHIKSYELIHTLRQKKGFADTKVSFANHLRIFVPKNKKNIFHVISAKLMEYAFQDSLTRSFSLGKSSFMVPKSLLKGIKPGKYYDFIGINYYTRDAITYFKQDSFEESKKNNLGWEIYPEGIGILAKTLYKEYQAPIYITENGTCDRDDAFRSQFIYDHLKVLLETNVPVERYYHWTFMDNFEWAEGETAPFGLVALNFETQERTIRKSGEYYSQIIETRELLEPPM